MKLVALIQPLIEDGTDVGGSVIDRFGGSRISLIAAERAGRRCFMMELELLYCDVIVHLWEAYTG